MQHDLLEKLLKFESTHDQTGQLSDLVHFVGVWLSERGLETKLYQHNGIWSVVAARKLKKHYRVILNGHLDVVPASYRGAFEPRIENGKMLARGTADMKGTVSAMMRAMVELEDLDDVALMLTGDEEVGGFDGVRYLLDEDGISCDCAFIPDGGNNFRITLSQKGILHLEVSAQGESAHGARPWRGENAIKALMEVVRHLDQNVPVVSEKQNWVWTYNLGKIEGGVATNSVAERAKMNLDFRFTGEDDLSEIWELLNTARDNSQAKIEFRELISGPAMNNDKSGYFLKKAFAAAKKHGVDLVPEKTETASDARFFADKNIPVVMFNPICSPGHIDDEWVDLESLEKYYEILKTWLLSLDG